MKKSTSRPSSETVGVVVEMLGARRGQMTEMHDTGQGTTRMVYIAPTRGLLGFRYQFYNIHARRGRDAHHLSMVMMKWRARCRRAHRAPSSRWKRAIQTAYALKSAEDRGHVVCESRRGCI